MAHTHINWGSHLTIHWDANDRTNTQVAVDRSKLPTVAGSVGFLMRASQPRVFSQSFQFSLDATKVNTGLRERRGRGLVITEVGARPADPPLAALAWHLPQPLTDPVLITTAAPRLFPVSNDALAIANIETGLVLLVDAVLHIAHEHREWALNRLASDQRNRKIADKQLGPVLVDVEGQNELEACLRRLFGDHAETHARAGKAVTLLRIRP